VGIRLALIVVFVACGPLCEAAEEPALAMQERVKAAFLYKFAGYVEWPPRAFAEAASPIVIGVAGADAIAHELERAAVGRTVAGRGVQVRRLARGEKAEACCQILFIAERERARSPDLLAQAQGKPVLVVTEAEAEHPKGSIINFVPADNRVRFDISREAAERNGLQLRSQLLSVARQVSPQ
jgi:hypothetical protein